MPMIEDDGAQERLPLEECHEREQIARAMEEQIARAMEEQIARAMEEAPERMLKRAETILSDPEILARLRASMDKRQARALEISTGQQTIERLSAAIEEALNCFHAAEAEGWSEAIQDLDQEWAQARAKDIWVRRISYAYGVLTEALQQAPA